MRDEKNLFVDASHSRRETSCAEQRDKKMMDGKLECVDGNWQESGEVES